MMGRLTYLPLTVRFEYQDKFSMMQQVFDISPLGERFKLSQNQRPHQVTTREKKKHFCLPTADETLSIVI